MKYLLILLIILFPMLAGAQVTATESLSAYLAKSVPVKASRITLDKPLVTIKDVETKDEKGNTVIQKQATDDVGITIHHHWTKYPDTARTIMQVGKNTYTGTSTRKDGNMEFTVDVVKATEVGREAR